MTYLMTHRFTSLFPGPFDVRPNREGVDDTFEIYCLTTESVVTRNHYWEAEEER